MKSTPIFVMMAATAVPPATKVNIQTVRDNYARFLKEDIPGILQTFSKDSVWIHNGNSAFVPYAGTFLGTEGIGRFFKIVGESIRMNVFEPSNYRGEGNQVVNDLHAEGVVLSTGKSFTFDGTHRWEFDSKGKAVRWEAKGDTSSLEKAFTK